MDRDYAAVALLAKPHNVRNASSSSFGGIRVYFSCEKFDSYNPIVSTARLDSGNVVIWGQVNTQIACSRAAVMGLARVAVALLATKQNQVIINPIYRLRHLCNTGDCMHRPGT
jgi:hypothetical protein